METIEIAIKSAYWGDGTHTILVGNDDGKVYISGFFGCSTNYKIANDALVDIAHRHGFSYSIL